MLQKLENQVNEVRRQILRKLGSILEQAIKATVTDIPIDPGLTERIKQHNLRLEYYLKNLQRGSMAMRAFIEFLLEEEHLYANIEDILFDAELNDLHANFSFNFDAFAEVGKVLRRACSMQREDDDCSYRNIVIRGPLKHRLEDSAIGRRTVQSRIKGSTKVLLQEFRQADEEFRKRCPECRKLTLAHSE